MTVQDFIDICIAEGIDPKDVRVVLGFVGGTTFNLSTIDASEAGDATTMFVTITEEVAR